MRRTRLRRIVQAPGLRLDPGASRTLCGHQPEALLLLLEWRAQRDQQRRSGRFSHLGFSGHVSAGLVGRHSRACARKARSVAFRGLDDFLSAIYYFVYPHARYRHPIEPELTILIVFLMSEVMWPTGAKARHLTCLSAPAASSATASTLSRFSVRTARNCTLFGLLHEHSCDSARL